MNSFHLDWKPVYPWSESPLGLPALAAVAGLLVAFTLWTYTGHPNATRRRILIVLTLRLLALIVALLTALQPRLVVEEKPNVPSVLLIGVDTSGSMSVKDELNKTRIDAVRDTLALKETQAALKKLVEEKNVTVVMYKFSTPDFSEGANLYTPGDPADGKRSDYGTYLNRMFQKWQNEKYIRGHLIIGDGINNGTTFTINDEIRAWKENAAWHDNPARITTFLVGKDDVDTNVRDIIVTGLDCDPSPVAIKTDVKIIGTVDAWGFAGTRAVARVFFDGKPVATEEVTLDKEKDNKVRMTVKAPPTRGEIKVTMQIGREQDGKLVELADETQGDNNSLDTYLTVTKDGVRVLIIDRLRTEEMRIRDALRSDPSKRFDINEVFRQTSLEPEAAEREFLNLDTQAYDVIIIGNISPEQLIYKEAGQTINVMDKIREKVLKNGTGLIFLGGEHAMAGMPADLLPVIVPPKAVTRPGEPPLSAIVENVEPGTQRPLSTYQTIPTEAALGFMMKTDKDSKKSRELWDKLNTAGIRLEPGRPKITARLTGYNKMTAVPGLATVYAWTSPEGVAIPAGTAPAAGADPLLVGWRKGDGNRGRILAFGGYDTFLWEKFGPPKSNEGTEIHTRFWRQVVLYLARQDEDEGEAYVRPTLRQLKVNGEQTLRVGVKLPGGGDDPNAELTVKIVPLPKDKAEKREPDQADIDKAKAQTVTRDAQGAKVVFLPREAREYFVVLTSPQKEADGRPKLDAKGKPLLHTATARFIAIADTTDEMQRLSAQPGFLKDLSEPTGGKALRLEELPVFLQKLADDKEFGPKPQKREYPDWRRNHSKGFLPLWLVLFAVLLGAEWGLRRLWGMV